MALQPHPLFRAEGHDLILDLPLAPWEAALGATVEIPTLEGKVKLRIPPQSQHGQKLRLAGRGLPKPRGGEGDLYAIVQIAVPEAPTERERGLFNELAQVSRFNPRTQLLREAAK